MSLIKRLFPALLTVLLAAAPAAAQTIDHAFASAHAYDSLGPEARQPVANQVWMFSHASVGANILDGMSTLHDTDPALYPLVRTEAGLDWAPDDAPRPGTVYDVDRGNPEWNEKYALFQTAVADLWGGKADFVMDKLCYIDQDADARAYLAMMERVEASTRAAVVYTTMPLTTEEDHDNDKRNAYNKAVRAFAAANDKLLFDIADLEAHDASGRACGYKGGQKLCQCWTDDGGHLDGRGQVQLAKAWYAMAAARAHEATTIPGTGWKLSLLETGSTP